MHEESIKLLQFPDDGFVSLCVYCETDELLALGERINARFEEAYMNGSGWDSLITYYAEVTEPGLISDMESDPEAGMHSISMDYSAENVAKLKRLEHLVRALVSDEAKLMAFIKEHYDRIEWDD